MKKFCIEGYKSFFDRQTVHLAGITILAGTNSSGKSSAMQPLLMLKQTLESQHETEAVLLAGSNVRFTSFDQVLSKKPGKALRSSFTLMIFDDSGWDIAVSYGRKKNQHIEISGCTITPPNSKGIQLRDGRVLTEAEQKEVERAEPSIGRIARDLTGTDPRVRVFCDAAPARCFPDLRCSFEMQVTPDQKNPPVEVSRIAFTRKLRTEIAGIIHIQGLRGNPERSYSSTARVTKSFPGVFTEYFAAVLQLWKESEDQRLEQIGTDLRALGLSWKVTATRIQDTQTEIRVSRLPGPTQGGAHDMVNLADVGLGVSQVLPLLVALRAAKPGQMVFVEQPELHLHPRAQFELVAIMVEASKRGVKICLETHSASIIRGLQIFVAQGDLDPTQLALNWFCRDAMTGSTSVKVAQINENGEYGDWPVDFDDVSMGIDKRYLNAVASRVF